MQLRDLLFDDHKRVCRMARVRRAIIVLTALEIPNLGASNGELNFEFQHFGADFVTFEARE